MRAERREGSPRLHAPGDGPRSWCPMSRRKKKTTTAPETLSAGAGSARGVRLLVAVVVLIVLAAVGVGLWHHFNVPAKAKNETAPKETVEEKESDAAINARLFPTT